MKMIAICVMAITMAAPAASYAKAFNENVDKVKVSYHDLDLTQPKDAAVMLQRLDRAGLEACGASSFSFRDYREAVRRSDCYKHAVNQAVTDLRSATVSEMYSSATLITSP